MDDTRVTAVNNDAMAPAPQPFDSVERAIVAGLPDTVYTALQPELDAIVDLLKHKKVLFVSQLFQCSRNDMETWLGEAEPRIGAHTIAIVEEALQHKFTHSVVPPSMQLLTHRAPSSSGTATPSGPSSGANSVTPPTLGNMLKNAQRFHEIAAFFDQPVLFEDVLVDNPQIAGSDDPFLKPKHDEKVTDIVLVNTWAKWGTLNVDKVFCSEVDRILRKTHKMFMPSRGKQKAIDRSWAESLTYKFPQFRSKHQKLVRPSKI